MTPRASYTEMRPRSDQSGAVEAGETDSPRPTLMRAFVPRGAKLLVYLFACVGIIDLIGRVVIAPISGMFYGHAIGLPVGFEKPEVVLSDDRSYKAIIYVWAGPAFDAGCDKFVSVVYGWAPVKTSWTKENIVYRAGCDEFTQISWEPPADGRVKPRLRIKADPAKGDFMSRSAMDGRVAIAYQGDH